MTITYFMAWFPCVLVYGAYAAMIFTYVRPKGMLGSHPAPAVDQQAILIFGAATIAFVFLLVGFGIYGIIMTLRYALAVPACAVENLKARAAIRRSIQLSQGARGRIFLLGLLALVIQLGLTAVTQGFFFVLGVQHKGVLPIWMSVLQQVLAFLTNTFVGPIYATGFTLFYYDQRVRKEGFDIEHMMQAAGMMELPPAVESGPILEAMASAEAGTVTGSRNE
jgi:uncharacterized membrane protein